VSVLRFCSGGGGQDSRNVLTTEYRAKPTTHNNSKRTRGIHNVPPCYRAIRGGSKVQRAVVPSILDESEVKASWVATRQERSAAYTCLKYMLLNNASCQDSDESHPLDISKT